MNASSARGTSRRLRCLVASPREFECIRCFTAPAAYLAIVLREGGVSVATAYFRCIQLLERALSAITRQRLVRLQQHARTQRIARIAIQFAYVSLTRKRHGLNPSDGRHSYRLNQSASQCARASPKFVSRTTHRERFRTDAMHHPDAKIYEVRAAMLRSTSSMLDSAAAVALPGRRTSKRCTSR